MVEPLGTEQRAEPVAAHGIASMAGADAVVTIARLRVAVDDVPKALSIFREMMARNRAEPGTLVQTIQRVESAEPDAAEFWFYELWACSAAREAHRTHGWDLRDRLEALLVEPIWVVACQPLYGHGIDFASAADDD